MQKDIFWEKKDKASFAGYELQSFKAKMTEIKSEFIEMVVVRLQDTPWGINKEIFFFELKIKYYPCALYLS